MTAERLEHLILVAGFKSRNFRYDKLIAYLAAGSIEIDIQTSTLYRTLYLCLLVQYEQGIYKKEK